MERKAYWNRVADELEEAAGRNDYRMLYRTMKRPSGKARATDDNIRKADGTFARSAAERLERWKEFFSELCNHESPQGPPLEPLSIQTPRNTFLDGKPNIDEIRKAVRSLKNGKLPGVDNITAEAIKAGGEVLLRRLHSLISLVRQSEVIPATWNRALVVPIHKKGDSRECKNYRRISLSSIAGKVFMKIIYLIFVLNSQFCVDRYTEVPECAVVSVLSSRFCVDQYTARGTVLLQKPCRQVVEYLITGVLHGRLCVSALIALSRLAMKYARYEILHDRSAGLPTQNGAPSRILIDAESRAEYGDNRAF
ncbi:hypothetical protein Y032_0037g3398 [Ancylostoma ceylanicum]|nr:hypothetical protein Y032_0037g3398 [Ancylostoma ceylanicum]